MKSLGGVLALLVLLAGPAAAAPKKLKLDRSTARGSALFSLEKATSAKKLPPLGNTWAWPPTFPGRGGDLVPDFVLCSLLTVETPGDTHVPGLVVGWRIDLIKDDETTFSAQGTGVTEKSTFTVFESLDGLDLENPDLVEVEFEFKNAKRLSFARLDCLARAATPAE